VTLLDRDVTSAGKERGHLAAACKIHCIKVCVCLHVDITAQGLLKAAIEQQLPIQHNSCPS